MVALHRQWKVLTDKENRQKLERDQRDLQKRQIREAVKKLAMKVKYSFIIVDLVSSLSVFPSHTEYIFRSVFQIIFDKNKQNTLSFVCSRENALLVFSNMGHPNWQFIRVISRQREITQGHSYSSIPTEEMQNWKLK